MGRMHIARGLSWTVFALLLAKSASAQDDSAQLDSAQPLDGTAEDAEAASAGAVQEDSEARFKKLEAALEAQEERLKSQEQEIERLNTQAEESAASAAAAEEAANLALTMDDEAGEVEEERLRFYGFADMAFSKKYIPEKSRFRGFVDNNSSFSMGNVNLYIDAKPSDSFRVLSEVRFSLFPHGTPQDDFSPTDNRIYDVTSATGRNEIIYSSIVMERAWIEWNKHDAFKVRTGYFFTPYGIWNVDHGSPTLISSALPAFWAEEYFPTRQVGLQVLGEFFVEDWELGYRAWTGNGRMSSQTDLDPFKHFGGRLYAKYTGKVRAQVGASGFYGRQREYEKSISSYDPFRVSSTATQEFTEYGLAGDISLDVGDLRVRTELVFNQEKYADGMRRATSPITYARDQNRYDGYGIVAYRLPWFGLEPYLFYDHAVRPAPEDNSASVYSAGLNVHLDAGIQYKLQGYYVHFHDDEQFPNASQAGFSGWDMRIVSAF